MAFSAKSRHETLRDMKSVAPLQEAAALHSSGNLAISQPLFILLKGEA